MRLAEHPCDSKPPSLCIDKDMGEIAGGASFHNAWHVWRTQRRPRWQCGSVDTASGVGVGAFLPAAVARELDSSSHWDDIGWLRKHSTPQSIRVAAPRQRSEKSTREGPIRGGEEKIAHDVAPYRNI